MVVMGSAEGALIRRMGLEQRESRLVLLKVEGGSLREVGGGEVEAKVSCVWIY
jgi:hypothetical protein